jgi:hypothetical protein
MTHAEISLTWQRIEAWSYDVAATRPIRIERIPELDNLAAAVYKLEFLDSSGALAEGPNTYVGETGGIRSRLKSHRYGRGEHGRKKRAAIVRHLQAGGSVRVSVLEINADIRIGGESIVTQPLSRNLRRLLEQAAIIEAQAQGAVLLNL